MHEKNAAVYSVAPNLAYHRNRARALLRALRAGEEYALSEFRHFHPEGSSSGDGRIFTLTDAQLIIARSQGFSSWTTFKRERENSAPAPANLEFIGFISERLEETKQFYLTFFHYSIQVDEPDGLVLKSPRGIRTLCFVRVGSRPKHVISLLPFPGEGVYLTFSTDDVSRDLERFRTGGVAIETGPLTTAGETLFMVRDPNGIGIYISEPSPLIRARSTSENKRAAA